LFAGAVGLMALAPNFEMLLACSVLAGMGNSVFHPADFGILNASVDPKRLGPAFSAHGISGNIGWALAPPIMTTLSAGLGSWRAALAGAALIGFALLALAFWKRDLFATAAAPRQPANVAAGAGGASVLLSQPILLCFVFFMLLAAGLIGIQTFGIPTLNQTYHLPPQLAAWTLTTFLLASGAGVLVGGLVAARAARHDHVAALGMAMAAGFIALVATVALPPWAILASLAAGGFCSGMTNPSRDLLVRAATPAGSTGKVYGFVYSGLDAGSAIAPTLFGTLLDHGHGAAVIYAIALLWLLTIGTIYGIKRPAGSVRPHG
jgi:MFS family permease